MDKFNKATKQVMDYLADNHYSKTILSVNKVCFNRLRQYLEESKISPISSKFSSRVASSVVVSSSEIP